MKRGVQVHEDAQPSAGPRPVVMTRRRRHDVRLGVKIGAEYVARIDRIAAVFKARQPGVEITRSDAARAAIYAGLDELERELNLHPEPPAPETRPARKRGRSRARKPAARGDAR